MLKANDQYIYKIKRLLLPVLASFNAIRHFPSIFARIDYCNIRGDLDHDVYNMINIYISYDGTERKQ